MVLTARKIITIRFRSGVNLPREDVGITDVWVMMKRKEQNRYKKKEEFILIIFQPD